MLRVVVSSGLPCVVLPMLFKNNKIVHSLLLAGFIGIAASASAAELQVRSVTFEQESTSKGSQANAAEVFAFQTDEATSLKYFTLDNPARVVIDLPTFRWRVPAAQLQAYKGKLLRQVRYARHSDTVSRIVLDLNQTVTPQLLTGTNTTQHRLRLAPAGAAPALATTAPAATTFGTTNREPVKRMHEVHEIATKEGTLGRIDNENDEVRTSEAMTETPRNGLPVPLMKPGKNAAPVASTTKTKRIIVIDAGHGGQDPGAIGTRGMQEKMITIAFAQALKERLDATGRYKAVLTRDKDFFIPLRQRVNIARQAKGDLFVSLHADSAPGSEARGLSVYSLSETASDAEAAKLAAKENKADIINGIDLSGASKDVTDILIDLTQRSTMTRSESLGASLLDGIRQNNVVTIVKPHRHAGFAVLKAPDIPSALVELGFVSHPEEEKLLQTSAHREQIVGGLVKGIDSYFAKTTTNR